MFKKLRSRRGELTLAMSTLIAIKIMVLAAVMNRASVGETTPLQIVKSDASAIICRVQGKGAECDDLRAGVTPVSERNQAPKI